MAMNEIKHALGFDPHAGRRGRDSEPPAAPRAPGFAVGPVSPLRPLFFETALTRPLPPGHGRRALRLAGRDRSQAASACSPTLEILVRRMREEASAMHGVGLTVLVGATHLGLRSAAPHTHRRRPRLWPRPDFTEKMKGTERKEKVRGTDSA
jgi:hypothetical protein